GGDFGIANGLDERLRLAGVAATPLAAGLNQRHRCVQLAIRGRAVAGRVAAGGGLPVHHAVGISVLLEILPQLVERGLIVVPHAEQHAVADAFRNAVAVTGGNAGTAVTTIAEMARLP